MWSWPHEEIHGNPWRRWHLECCCTMFDDRFDLSHPSRFPPSKYIFSFAYTSGRVCVRRCISDGQLASDCDYILNIVCAQLALFCRYVCLFQGNKASLMGESSRALAIWLSSVRKSQPDLVVHECTSHFAASLFDEFLPEMERHRIQPPQGKQQASSISAGYMSGTWLLSPNQFGWPCYRPRRFETAVWFMLLVRCWSVLFSWIFWLEFRKLTYTCFVVQALYHLVKPEDSDSSSRQDGHHPQAVCPSISWSRSLVLCAPGAFFLSLGCFLG